jgi:septum formation protein
LLKTIPAIYLASASPRRHQILLQMEVRHDVLDVPTPPGEDEPQLADEAPHIYVRRTAREKAQRAVAWLATQQDGGATDNPLPQRAILAADTTVILRNDILGKPANVAEARDMLKRLSGRLHSVHTAVVLADGDRLLEDVSVTEVRFKKLTDAEIQAYCNSGEPMGKAGAYGIQGKAALFIQYISGSYTGVMGLPVFETGRLLETLAR